MGLCSFVKATMYGWSMLLPRHFQYGTLDIILIWQHNPMMYDHGAFQIIVNGISSNMAIRLCGLSFKMCHSSTMNFNIVLECVICMIFFKNIARVRNCPDVTILNSLIGLCLLYFCLFCHYGNFVLLSCCLFVILSFCLFVILSFCHVVFLPCCHFVILSFCHFVI